jgi:hypothetical protein
VNEFIEGLISLSFIYGVIASLAAAAIGLGLRWLVLLIKYKSSYDGRWQTIITNDDKTEMLVDNLDILRNPKTGEIKGTLERISPKSSWNKRKIRGVLTREKFLMVSFTDEPISSMSSSHLISIGNYHYKGKLLRYKMDTQSIECVDIEIRKS